MKFLNILKSALIFFLVWFVNVLLIGTIGAALDINKPESKFSSVYALVILILPIVIGCIVLSFRRKRKDEPSNEQNIEKAKKEKPLPKSSTTPAHSFCDLFKGKENEQLKSRVAELEALLTPEMQDSIQLQEKIKAQEQSLADLTSKFEKDTAEQSEQLAKQKADLTAVQQQLTQASAELVETEEEVLMQSFGLYKPRYSFANATGYKDELAKVRNKQKDMIKAGTAATGSDNWTVNGNKRQGAKMIHDMQKLLVRAFNCECDDVVSNVKFNNVEAGEKRINTAFSTISKLGSVCGVAITAPYRILKIQELHLAYEYQVEKQKEKEELRQLRAEERERAKLEKEIAEARRKIEKEQLHYSNALCKLLQQMASASPDELPALQEKKAEIEAHLMSLDESSKEIDYREANQKAGYVYIISNIGAFGEGIYKIGMTRRLEPMERIYELSDASVPFNFDVHAMIFSDDAPALEAALHRAFDSRKLNMVNTRREFFRVSLDEIKEVVNKNFDKTVEFVDVPSADQYRQSELIRKNT